MRILFDNPRKTNWTLNEVTLPGGIAYPVGTGRYSTPQGAVVRNVPNKVFEAEFKAIDLYRGDSSITYKLEERSEPFGLFYETGARGILDMVMALQTGLLCIRDGYMFGRYTFAKQGTRYYVMPYEPGVADAKVAAEDGHGVPHVDVAAVLAELPRPRSMGKA